MKGYKQTMKPKQLRVIRCPECGYEYLPAEIYLPDEFLGKPNNVVRDFLGKIMGYEGIKMNDTEKYICDNCNTSFEVVSTTNFVSRKCGGNEPHYSTKLKKEKHILEET
jgi:DNA-directed RNA polymerase subunit RPC12/RpoP